MVIGAIVLSAVLLSGVFILLLRRQLREKYAILWIIIGLAALVLGLVPGLLGAITEAFGFQVPANLLFTLAIVLLLGVSLHLSWELTRSEEKVRRLAEEAGIAGLERDKILDRLITLEQRAENDGSGQTRGFHE
ncbi:DUF2304 domain-containing protein [Microbacterium sp. YY-03]|uniref:DUF2304 domain-containing protein n=1 Tax=Microbacterium sp. YY-03 TaxID=3421636 RepID=UPI003D173DBA